MSSTSRLLDAASAAAAATKAENRDADTFLFADDPFKHHEEALRVHLDDFRALQEVALTRFASKQRYELGRICASLFTRVGVDQGILGAAVAKAADVTSAATTANITDAFSETARDSNGCGAGSCARINDSHSVVPTQFVDVRDIQGQHSCLELQQSQFITSLPSPVPVTSDCQSHFSHDSFSSAIPCRLSDAVHQSSSMLKFCSPPTQKRMSRWEKLSSTLVVHGHLLDFVSGVVVTLFAIFIGFETDFMSKNQGSSHESFKICHFVFNMFFAAEVLLRVVADGRHFFIGRDRCWNTVDTVMVLSSLFEVLFEFFANNDKSTSKQVVLVVKTLRVLRLVKTCRIARSLRYMHEFKRMVFAFQGSVTTLGWCMALIFAMLYIFAIFFTQGCTDYISDRIALGSITAESLSLHFTSDDSYDLHSGVIDERVELRTLWSRFGTLPRSIFSLYTVISNGRDWEDVLRPIMCMHWVYTVVFMSFITFSIFGLLNVLTSIFLESVVRSVLHYRELLVQDAQAKKQEAIGHLRTLFKQMDGTDVSEILVDDMKERFETSTECSGLLEACDISINDVDALIALLDRDGSGTIGIDEFCEGCLKLKGPAKSFDIHCLIYETLCFFDKFASFTNSCETRSNDLAQRLTALNSSIIAQNRDVTTAMARLQSSIASLSLLEVARGRIDGCSHNVPCSKNDGHGCRTRGSGAVDYKSSDVCHFSTDSFSCRLNPRNDSFGGAREIVKKSTKLSL